MSYASTWVYKMSIVVDAFSFYNELELLEIRLHELGDVVDKFVLVEATRTHAGNPKELFFQNNKPLFYGYLNKIVHIVVDDMPITPEQIRASLSSKDVKWIESQYQAEDSWVRERYQRNAMMREIQKCAPDDIIIISDADEIVRNFIARNADLLICDGSNAIQQELRAYYLNVACVNMPWHGSKIVRRKYLDENTPSEIRFHTPPCQCITDGGWHFGYLGGVKAIQNKIKSFAHQEFNDPKFTTSDTISGRLDQLKDVLGRLYEYKPIPLDANSVPKYVLDNQEKFAHLIYRGENVPAQR